MRILLAEDDDLLGSGLRAGLMQHGFEVDWVRDGVMAERELRSQQHQAAVLDLGLPRLDGTEVLQRIRQAHIKLPILVLTARDTIADRVAGLNMGADDYVVKPVDLVELAARLNALIRRSHGHAEQHIQVGNIILDPMAKTVSQDQQLVHLSHREFDVLHCLMLQAGRVLSRAQLEQHLYSWGHEVESNAVEVHIHHLRRKLGSQVIETVRGVGYVMNKAAASS
jgi:two-component system OmpR family response regulator/two-component system response regulator QseB